LTEKIEISVPIFPSEDIGKVKQAVSNLLETPNFNEIRINGTTYLTCILEERAGLDKLREMIKKERIRNAARRLLRKDRNRETLVFFLNKQAAYVGRVSFSKSFGESPLGTIRFKIESEDIDSVIDWLAPRVFRKPNRLSKRKNRLIT
jgi:predicted RNA binding protein with dsRBD fold (UPF0201 family)